MYDRIVIAPGQAISLGSPEGGELLIQSAAAGAMSLTDLQSRVLHLLNEDPAQSGGIVLALADLQDRVWHLLREPGPDTGDAVVTTGDFSAAVVTRDLNVAQALFISATGISYVGSPIMVASTDVPAVSPQYAMALVYRVLVDYWQRKSDAEQSKAYAELYAKEVARASRGQGNFTSAIITRDLNIALAQFISDTGIAPAISERFTTLPVFAVMDYPLPADLVALTRLEYKPQGQYPYVVRPLSFSEFDSANGGLVPPVTGQPRYYREPYAGYIRLQPAPSAGNASGPANGVLTFSGAPVPGTVVTVRLIATTPPYSVTVAYTSLVGETLSSLAANLSSAINASGAVQGANAFLLPSTIGLTTSSSTTIVLTALSALVPYTAFSYYVTNTAATLTVTPGTSMLFSATGDVFTAYYTSLGRFLISGGDTPGIPPQFHMALVYRVLMDYWQRKGDEKQSMRFEAMYGKMVVRGKSYTFDMNRASQPTIAGDDTDEYPSWP